MAIDISDLTSFYSPELFQSGNNSVILEEKQQNAGALSSVEILTPGAYILIKPGFLNESKEAYRKIDKHISYRDINDGTLLVEYKGKRYLVYIELKSGYNGVCSKAIYQLPVSSIKIKSYLRNFASYTPGEYEEVGLIVSFPPKTSDKYDDSNNDMVLANKTGYAALQNNAENKFDKGFRQHSMVNANASDYPTLDQSRLHEYIKFNTLDIYHHTVNGNGEKIDLSQYLH